MDVGVQGGGLRDCVWKMWSPLRQGASAEGDDLRGVKALCATLVQAGIRFSDGSKKKIRIKIN